VEVKPHFKALLTLRAPRDGGRETPLNLRMYRPDLSFDDDRRAYYGAHPTLEDRTMYRDQWVDPGETFETYFLLRAPSEIVPHLRVGSRFRMMEGGRAVADGTVTFISLTDTT
jgi:translation elongation factor EF-Tu-like GTPase